MKYLKRLLLIDDTDEISSAFISAFANDDFVKLITSSSDFDDLKEKLRYDFFIIYIHHDGLKTDIHLLVDFLTKRLNYIKPMILAISSDHETLVSTDLPGVGFLPKPVNIKFLHQQALNTISILSTNRSINDVSHLPGNYAIDATLRKKIEAGEKFVLVYLDIDKFKPYTDHYGLYRAGLLIGFLADILNYSVRKYGLKNDFVGHVGGDDFVLILNDYDYAESIGAEIIYAFDNNIEKFYDAEDLKNGYIEVLNRKGQLERFGLISISIAMVSNQHVKYSTTDAVYKRMMIAKDEAKQISGSVMLCDTSRI